MALSPKTIGKQAARDVEWRGGFLWKAFNSGLETRENKVATKRNFGSDHGIFPLAGWLGAYELLKGAS